MTIVTALLSFGCSVNEPPLPAAPAARLEHAMIYDEARHQVLLYGGMDGGVAMGDLWAWTGTSWAKLSAGGPPARFGAVLAWDPAASRVLMYGGAASGTHLTDLWSWNGTAWTQLPSTGGPGLGHAAGGWDAARSRLVIHRGFSGTAPERDTWEWNGSTWTQVSTAVPVLFGVPLPAPMVYDPVRNALLMLIGDANTHVVDLWQWNGTAWTSVTTPPAGDPPSAIALFGTNDILMMDGRASAGATMATWRWNGTTWTNLGITGPPSRFVSRMAWDASRNQLVLFGGMNASGNGMGDTWIWNGSSWNQKFIAE